MVKDKKNSNKYLLKIVKSFILFDPKNEFKIAYIFDRKEYFFSNMF